MTHPGIFILGEEQNLIELRSSPYDSEALLQALLATHPNLLVGDQIDPTAPCRWLLIKQEAGVPDESGASDRWSIDHLFVDQYGVPTLIEVKRSTDTRIRREVVGQMLDYAAHCVKHWRNGLIRSLFERRCQDGQLDSAATLSEFLEGGDPEAFWNTVQENLEKGRIRLIFVADEIPTELRRVIEFLNLHMDRVEVLGIEIRHYTGGSFRGLVPRVVGQTEQSLERKRAGIVPAKRQWDIPSFREELESRFGKAQLSVADRIIAWAQEHGGRVWAGNGTTDGSLYYDFARPGEKFFLFALWTYGKVEVQFQWLARAAAFESDASRDELRQRLNAIPGVAIPPEAITKRPSIPFALLTDERAFALFLDAIAWAVTVAGANSSDLGNQ